MKKKMLIGILLVVMLSLAVVSSGGTAVLNAQETSRWDTAPLEERTPNAVTAVALAPADTPTTLVSKEVSSYALARSEYKLFWAFQPTCQPTARPEGATTSSPQNIFTDEAIQRIATYGSDARRLYYNEVSSICGQQAKQIYSNIAADADYVYWLTWNDLVRLPTSANEGDDFEVMATGLGGWGEVAVDSDNVYVARDGVANITAVRKSNQSTFTVANMEGSNLSAVSGYVYWQNLDGQWNLHFYNLSTGGIGTINNVNAYYAEGIRCAYYCSHRVYVTGVGASRKSIWVYDHDDGLDPDAIYTSSDNEAIIHTMTGDFYRLFFFEARDEVCGSLICYRDLLFRAGRSGTGVELLYTYPSAQLGYNASNLTSNWQHIFWRDSAGKIYRMRNDAGAAPNLNARVTDMQITQGIYDPDISVPLIAGRRTFVRVYVESDFGLPVEGVTAELSEVSHFGDSVRPMVTHITVQPNPNPDVLNESFLFELPYDWTQHDSGLNLRFDLNPFRVPIETNYSDNVMYLATSAFSPSPSLETEIVSFGYELSDTDYYPVYHEDVLPAFSWIRRVYPLGGNNFSPSHRQMFVEDLGERVDQSHEECEDNLCASAYTNRLMEKERIKEGIGGDVMWYGMISARAGHFPRGQAIYVGSPISSGPAGPTVGGGTDVYAAHEVGHSVNLLHPDTGNWCGHSADDADYPYAGSFIGPAGGDVWGYDPLLRQVLPGDQWTDVMSYCHPDWISAHNYNNIYDHLMGATRTAETAVSTAKVAGDFLIVLGQISADGEEALISPLSRVDSVAVTPPLTPGGYSIRLVGSGGSTLADYPFTPSEEGSLVNGEGYGISQVVDFVSGTTAVQIVRLSDDQVLTSVPISPNPPQLSDVALQNPPDPIAGPVTLSWTASDADGDLLSFDVYYVRSGNVELLQSGLSTESTTIDTDSLGGYHQAAFRVVASDGAHTTEAETPAFFMPRKPPIVHINTPGDGLHVRYGQLVNFSADYDQFNQGLDVDLRWYANDVYQGRGLQLSLDDLPVGENEIRFSVRLDENSTLKAHDSITVFVEDDLKPPDATLAIGPETVSWHVSGPSAGAQTADIAISNRGDGSLNWTAVAGADWLTLSGASGSVPGVLTITADPTAFADGDIVKTDVVISGTNGEDVTVPVTLYVGDTWTNASSGDDASFKVYLPTSMR